MLEDLDGLAGGLADRLCQPAALTWCRSQPLFPARGQHGETFHWARCGQVGGNLCHWLYWRATGRLHGPDVAKARPAIWGGIWKLWRHGNINADEAEHLWRSIAGYSSSIRASMCGGGACSSGASSPDAPAPESVPGASGFLLGSTIIDGIPNVFIYAAGAMIAFSAFRLVAAR